jgi:hypothetical protein
MGVAYVATTTAEVPLDGQSGSVDDPSVDDGPKKRRYIRSGLYTREAKMERTNVTMAEQHRQGNCLHHLTTLCVKLCFFQCADGEPVPRGRGRPRGSRGNGRGRGRGALSGGVIPVHPYPATSGIPPPLNVATPSEMINRTDDPIVSDTNDTDRPPPLERVDPSPSSLQTTSAIETSPSSVINSNEVDRNGGMVIKRGRGRPPGPAKSTLLASGMLPPPSMVNGVPAKRGRGRPRGSTNKQYADGQHPRGGRRGRGRGRGITSNFISITDLHTQPSLQQYNNNDHDIAHLVKQYATTNEKITHGNSDGGVGRTTSDAPSRIHHPHPSLPPIITDDGTNPTPPPLIDPSNHQHHHGVSRHTIKRGPKASRAPSEVVTGEQRLLMSSLEDRLISLLSMQVTFSNHYLSMPRNHVNHVGVLMLIDWVNSSSSSTGTSSSSSSSTTSGPTCLLASIILTKTILFLILT